MSNKLPYVQKPCKDCPFRKDSMKGWLGEERIAGIINDTSFTCHKTQDPKRLQCAGHMLLREHRNDFVRMAIALRIDLNLQGRELVFDNEQDCIKHHKY